MPTWLRAEVRHYVASERHGSLPALLLALTVASGLVDAVSILSLGRVFVSNVTGNIVFIGFALAGARLFAVPPTLAALVGFLLGASLEGLIRRRYAVNRAALLLTVTVIETVLLAGATITCALQPSVLPDTTQVVLAGVCAVAFGLQLAAVRRIAVPDLTTTLITMDMIGLVADRRHTDQPGVGRRTARRRVVAVLAMFVGAVVGATLVIQLGPAWPLGISTVITGGVALLSARAGRAAAEWQTFSK